MVMNEEAKPDDQFENRYLCKNCNYAMSELQFKSTLVYSCPRCGCGLWRMVPFLAAKPVLPMNSDGLKPCPFCGGKVTMGNYHVICKECGISGPGQSGNLSAEDRWNKRCN